MPNKLSINWPIISNFASSSVKARRKNTGGYAATPLLPASMEDTYHALDILQTLNEMTHLAGNPAYRSDRILLDYLSAVLHSSWAGVRRTFQLLKACELARVRVDTERAEQFVLSQLGKPFSLQGQYYSVRIVREVLQKDPMIIFEGRKTPPVSRLVWRTVDEAWMILYLARAMQDSTLPLFELATWFQACQYWDGGFRFLPHTTSFIENCHTCLRALALLGIKPLDLSGAYRFILVSHTASGGLSRNSRATPFLDATCHAIAGIALIQSFEAA